MASVSQVGAGSGEEVSREVSRDGPRRAGGSRMMVFDKIDLRNCAVIADDAGGENNIAGLKTHLDRTHNTVVIERFVVGAPKPALAVAAE